MLRTLLGLTLAMICCTAASAQQPKPQCPTISVTGPPGRPEPGQLVPFSVEIKPAVLQLAYKWSVSSGSVASGQGTQSIGVKFDPNGGVITATVEIGGLPQNCPARASETAAWSDRTPRPTRIATYSLPLSSITDERFQSIVDAVRDNPTSQIYILVPSVKEVRDALSERLKKVVNPSVDPSHITVVDTVQKNTIVEVWLVPSGATPPVECEGCEKVNHCSTISVTGPPDVVRPGDTATYTASVSDATAKGLEYEWEVSLGTIVSERNTSTIKVRMPTDQNDVAAVATVTVKGLPVTCPNRVSETAVVSYGWDPRTVDEYGRLPRNDEKARLVNVSDELAKNPNMVAFMVLRVPKKLGWASYNARMKTITTLFNSLRVSKDKYVFVDAGDDELSTTIYLMPPSAAPDSWKTGKSR